MKAVEPILRFCLGFAIERSLQLLNLRWGSYPVEQSCDCLPASSRTALFGRESPNSTGGTLTHEAPSFTGALLETGIDLPRRTQRPRSQGIELMGWLIQRVRHLSLRTGPGNHAAPTSYPLRALRSLRLNCLFWVESNPACAATVESYFFSYPGFGFPSASSLSQAQSKPRVTRSR